MRMPEEWEWRWGYASLYWVGAPHCTAAEAADGRDDACAAGGIRTRRIQPRLSLNQQHAKMNMSFLDLFPPLRRTWPHGEDFFRTTGSSDGQALIA